MKCLGAINDPKDIVNKEYVDSQNEIKLEEGDLNEMTNEELLALWNTHID